MRSAGGVACAVRVRSGARELAAVDDQVFLANRALVEEALEDLAHTRGVAGLRGEACAGGVRGHALIGHRAPRMVGRGGLGKPHVAGVACQLPALTRACDGLAIADLPSSGVDQIGASLHLGEHVRVEEVFGFGV